MQTPKPRLFVGGVRRQGGIETGRGACSPTRYITVESSIPAARVSGLVEPPVLPANYITPSLLFSLSLSLSLSLFSLRLLLSRTRSSVVPRGHRAFSPGVSIPRIDRRPGKKRERHRGTQLSGKGNGLLPRGFPRFVIVPAVNDASRRWFVTNYRQVRRRKCSLLLREILLKREIVKKMAISGDREMWQNFTLLLSSRLPLVALLNRNPFVRFLFFLAIFYLRGCELSWNVIFRYLSVVFSTRLALVWNLSNRSVSCVPSRNLELNHAFFIRFSVI